MKLIALLLLAVSLFASNAMAADTAQPQAQPDFRETLSKATLAVYEGKEVCEMTKVETIFGSMSMWGCSFKEQFICTATVINRTSQYDYTGLTAGHCFNWKLDDKGVKYYVADNVRRKPVLHEISVLKRENDERYDYALFTFKSITVYPVIEIYSGEGIPPIGSRVLNCNYSLGITKEVVDGPIVSDIIGDTESEEAPHLRRRYFVQLPFGPGASGSPVVDEQTHQIVGLVEAMFPGSQMAAVVIPTGTNLINFIQDDSAGIRPEPAPDVKNNPQPGDTAWSRIVKFIAKLFHLSVA